MKTKIIMIFVILIITISYAFSEVIITDEKIKNSLSQEIKDDEVILFIYRMGALFGSAVPWPSRILEVDPNSELYKIGTNSKASKQEILDQINIEILKMDSYFKKIGEEFYPGKIFIKFQGLFQYGFSLIKDDVRIYYGNGQPKVVEMAGKDKDKYIAEINRMKYDTVKLSTDFIIE